MSQPHPLMAFLAEEIESQLLSSTSSDLHLFQLSGPIFTHFHTRLLFWGLLSGERGQQLGGSSVFCKEGPRVVMATLLLRFSYAFHPRTAARSESPKVFISCSDELKVFES